MPEPRYHTRGYLPHFDIPEATQFLTWRLVDAIPAGSRAQILAETDDLPEDERHKERMKRADRVLDEGKGSAVLKEWRVASVVQDALFYGHRRRYLLRAFVVMPNHAHAVLTLLPNESLSTVVRTVKSYSAREANKLLRKNGRFWQIEVFDRLIRSPEQCARTVEYIEWNPVKAKLVADPKHFFWSSANPANAEILADG